MTMSISILRFSPDKTSYEEGDIINFTVDILNRDVAADYQISLIDTDTDRRVANIQGTNLQNGHRRIEKGVITYMSSESMNIRIDVLRIPLEEGVDVEISDSKNYTVYLEGDEPTTLDGEEITPPEPDVIEEIPVAPELVTPSLPIYLQWLAPIIEWLNGFGGFLYSWFGVFRDNLANIGDFFKDPVNNVLKKSTNIGNTFQEESANITLNALNVVTSESPKWQLDMKDRLQEMLKDYQKELPLPEDWTKTGIIPDSLLDKVNTLDDFAKGVTTSNITWWLAHVLTEGLTLGQVEAISQVKPMVIDPTGVNEITKLPLTIPLEPALIIPAQQYFNSVFTPNYPSVDWLIQMVVKEKIKISEFQTIMSYEGIPQKWSQLIWDAHFIAPNFGQLLVMKRRGIWTDEKLTEMQILVDLDPLYDKVWEQNWYVDPTARQARFMFELGSINEAQVKDIVIRSGLDPTYVDAFTDYLTKFEERIWRRRYLMSISMGYKKGVFSVDELTKEILDSGYSKGVAGWMIREADIRIKIDEEKVKPPKVKVLPFAMVSELVIRGLISYPDAETYIMQLGYTQEQTDLILKVLKRRKWDKEVVKKVVIEEEEEVIYKTLSQVMLFEMYSHAVLSREDIIAELLENNYTSIDAERIVQLFDARIREDELKGEAKEVKEEIRKYKPPAMKYVLDAYVDDVIDRSYLHDWLLKQGYDEVDIGVIMTYMEKYKIQVLKAREGI